MLTKETLQSKLHYNPDTGIFTRICDVGGFKKGTVAGTKHICSNGVKTYIRIGINGKYYLAHRLAWLYMTGEMPQFEIDHIDCDGLNNRFNNLRQATSAQNAINKSKRSGTKSTLKGVTWYKRNQKWAANIIISGKRHYLGLFATEEDAHRAYCEASNRLHGRFANHGRLPII
jgi:hypothetical protein